MRGSREPQRSAATGRPGSRRCSARRLGHVDLLARVAVARAPRSSASRRGSTRAAGLLGGAQRAVARRGGLAGVFARQRPPAPTARSPARRRSRRRRGARACSARAASASAWRSPRARAARRRAALVAGGQRVAVAARVGGSAAPRSTSGAPLTYRPPPSHVISRSPTVRRATPRRARRCAARSDRGAPATTARDRRARPTRARSASGLEPTRDAARSAARPTRRRAQRAGERERRAAARLRTRSVTSTRAPRRRRAAACGRQRAELAGPSRLSVTGRCRPP